MLKERWQSGFDDNFSVKIFSNKEIVKLFFVIFLKKNSREGLISHEMDGIY